MVVADFMETKTPTACKVPIVVIVCLCTKVFKYIMRVDFLVLMHMYVMVVHGERGGKVWWSYLESDQRDVEWK